MSGTPETDAAVMAAGGRLVFPAAGVQSPVGAAARRGTGEI